MNGSCLRAYSPAPAPVKQRPGKSSMYAFQEIPARSSWSTRLVAPTLQSVQSLEIPNVEPPVSAR